ncbi:MAG: hypothetical protein AW11_03417 [Candidatus Accumulibacter regalis]|jgi:uncharacterized protein (TIGR02217 family)|uniref:DUF2460 domain-containing protein n=1 Tax=Accumulibacter regalis TaxID=522306 RepID=A0A011R339_ACCRE|nr:MULTISPECIES: DUF2460 domain-containing protein [unclassified Candidatus Accumulibacter]EXI85589.1 MAG: hypothetical protein AW11_03417 [Candidatus Accumulibacter regalis]MBN8513544.1 DUF2460 domain-containing protein [Accumulibacter sp.]MBO3701808.1 DUF2460 domain-containing protein [Accumulibacter sp.]HRE72613.1 DUF2460 domain-containing protein [Accumulibacter sp.]
MSNEVFPALPGLKWGIVKTPEWSTKVQRSANGRELRAAFFSYPIWHFTLSYEVLRGANGFAELQALVGFFNARQGSFDSFLYSDPSDNAVTAQAFGTGNGSTTAFQLKRTYGGATEPIFGVNGSPSIYVGGVPQGGGYTISSTGLVTFSAAPPAAAALTWTGQFYFRCRFANDQSEFEQFLRDLWQARKVEFVTDKGAAA